MGKEDKLIEWEKCDSEVTPETVELGVTFSD